MAALMAKVAFADNSNLLAFSRKNAEKFKNEIATVGGLNLGTNSTAIAKLDFNAPWSDAPVYDAEAGEAVFNNDPSGLLVSETCKSKGTFKGQNSFGAKATVRAQSCERFFVRDGDVMAVRIRNLRLKMPPAVFRLILKDGVVAAYDFSIGHTDQSEVVSFSDDDNEATIEYPVKTNMKVWTVYAKLTEIRWTLPGEEQPIVVWPQH